MNYKKKIIIIGVCIIIVIAVLVANVIRGIKSVEEDEIDDIVVKKK